MTDLLPCPFCGSDKKKLQIATNEGITGCYWFVFCTNCLCQGPNVLDDEPEQYNECKIAWNSRCKK